MQKQALIVWGGWKGHEPEQQAEFFADMLKKERFDVEVSDTLDSFADEGKLKELDLIVPIWSIGELSNELADPVIEAVADGTGIAGCHGGMCDAFRKNVKWQFMTGGNWVSHPGGTEPTYRVYFKQGSSPLVEGLADFEVTSEQYYLHVDPAVEVLATTRFPVANWYHAANGPVDMPVIWTKRWGVGRVFYCSIGHNAASVKEETPKEIMRRGFLWAAEGKRIAREKGLDASSYRSTAKMF
jgi:type 1 glutamine amidotransferase